jgi:N-acetylglutamate synthase-like GNAT family acetyltransferase
MKTIMIRPEIKIRTATEADILDIEALIEPFVEYGTLLGRTYDELEDLLPTMFVAEVDGRIVGCAALEVYSRKLAELRSLAVAPEMQGTGIGKKLVQAVIDLAKEKDILEVITVTSADQFFMNCGFDYTLPSLKRALFIQTREK